MHVFLLVYKKNFLEIINYGYKFPLFIALTLIMLRARKNNSKESFTFIEIFTYQNSTHSMKQYSRRHSSTLCLLAVFTEVSLEVALLGLHVSQSDEHK